MLRAYAAYSGVTLRASYAAVPPNGIELSNGVPSPDLAGAANSATYFHLQAPLFSTVSFSIAGGSGDADLYTRLGTKPTITDYACRPYLIGNDETCTHFNSSTGDWYVMLRGYASYARVTLVASY